MTDTEQLIKDQFARLPAEMQKALNVVPWKSSVKEIAITNKMSLEQVEIIERETMFILYGFESPEDYITNLMREAQINEAVAKAITQAVEEKIFKAIELQLEITPEKKLVPTSVQTPTLPQVIHNSLPMIEPHSAQGFGVAKEVVHEVKHEESTIKKEQEAIKIPKTQVPVPNYSYEGGKDPYREPLK